MQGQESTEAYLSLLHQAMSVIGREQRIHLHCFNDTAVVGGVSMHLLWVHPAGAVLVRHSSRAYLQAVPAGRVLLETDAPYFQFPGHRHSFHGLIGMCDGVVALALGVSWESLLERSVANARALYDGGD